MMPYDSGLDKTLLKKKKVSLDHNSQYFMLNLVLILNIFLLISKSKLQFLQPSPKKWVTQSSIKVCRLL